jgi:hypothetical protein
MSTLPPRFQTPRLNQTDPTVDDAVFGIHPPIRHR